MHRSALEAAAKQAGCTIERDGALFVVRDDWTENEDHAAWLVATKVGVPLESVTVGLRAERSGANGVTPARDGDDFTRSSPHRNSRPGGRCPKRRAALRIMGLAGARAWSAAASGARPRRELARTRCALSHSHSKATVSMSGARRPRAEMNHCDELVAASGAVARPRLRVRARGRAGLGEPPVLGGLRSCPLRVSQWPKRGAAMAGVARPPGARGRRSPRAWLLRQPLPARPDGTGRAGAKADPGGAVAADGHAVRRRV